MDIKEWFLDQKIELWKSAKKKDIFLRGYSIVFVQKSNFFSCVFFEESKDHKKCQKRHFPKGLVNVFFIFLKF